MKISSSHISFLGAGNMAEAIVRGLVGSGRSAPGRITVTDVRPERLDEFEKTFGVRARADNRAAAAEADVVVLAVKPQQAADVLGSIRGVLKPGALFVSIAAGLRCDRIEEALGGGVRIVRVMPNTPALAGAGASAVCAGRLATEHDLALAEDLFGAVGLVVRVSDRDMDAVTAVSGSGPAYVFYLIEAMQEAATRLGLEPDTARRLVLATVEGSAKLMSGTGLDAAELRRRVTSKGGTTEAAVKVLDGHRVRDAWVEALQAAAARSKELSGG